MNIWKVIKNEGFNNAFLINENGEQCFDKDSSYMEIQLSPSIRNLKIEQTDKGFADVMNYWGTSGTFIVNSKTRFLIESFFGTLSIQFLPCHCSQYPDLDLWVLNVCEYHDVLDLNNCVCRKMHNFEGKEVIRSIKKYAFSKEAFDLDIFKTILNNRKDNISLFVSDRFKNIMEENNVTGLALEKVYSM